MRSSPRTRATSTTWPSARRNSRCARSSPRSATASSWSPACPSARRAPPTWSASSTSRRSTRRRRERASGSDLFRQAIQEDVLAGKDLLARFREREPVGAVDLGEGLAAAALRRPFHLEAVAADFRNVELAFGGEGDHALAARLRGLAERLERGFDRHAQLLLELPPGGGFGVLAFHILPLRNRPGARVLLRPERPAGMDKKHLQRAVLAFVEEHPGAFDGHQEIVTPPSATITWPVMKLAAGEARKAATPPISSGVPIRRSGVRRLRRSSARSSSHNARAKSVLTSPGATQLTRTFL